MYSKIVDPETGIKISLTTQFGKKILKKYLNILKGGSSPDAADLTHSTSASSAAASGPCGVHRPGESGSDKLCQDFDCGKFVDSEKIVEGGYKKVFAAKCADMDYFSTFKGGDDEERLRKCNESVFMKDSSLEENFNNEITTSIKINKPEVFRYGRCSNDPNLRFKIEERFDEDLLTI